VSTTQHQSHAAPASPSTALRHRKNVASLSAVQLQTLRTSFATAEGISDDRGFAHWAGIHGLPLPMFCQHGTRLFLPWHRAYLYFFELALRDLVPDARPAAEWLALDRAEQSVVDSAGNFLAGDREAPGRAAVDGLRLPTAHLDS
jgi:hypothetical protein